MNHRTGYEQMLADALAEAVPADYRDAMLSETLRLVRRRRRWRQTRRGAGLLAALALCAIFIWQKNLSRQPVAPAPTALAVAENYQLIQTRALPASMTATTQPLTTGQLIAPAASIGMVQTSSGGYRVLDDTELLALVASHPAVLVRTGPHSEELVFANPEDAGGFPLN